MLSLFVFFYFIWSGCELTWLNRLDILCLWMQTKATNNIIKQKSLECKRIDETNFSEREREKSLDFLMKRLHHRYETKANRKKHIARHFVFRYSVSKNKYLQINMIHSFIHPFTWETSSTNFISYQLIIDQNQQKSIENSKKKP